MPKSGAVACFLRTIFFPDKDYALPLHGCTGLTGVGLQGGFSVINFGALFSQLLATCWWLPPVLILAALVQDSLV